MTEASRFDINSVIDDAKRVLLDPAGFYRDMARSGGYIEPLIFIVVMGFIAGVIAAVGTMLFGGIGFAMGFGFAALIMLPLWAAIGSFISGAIMFIIWKLMGSDQSYETSWRCCAYAAASFPVIMIAQLVPYLGAIVGAALGYWLMSNATVQVHGIAEKKARLVIGILSAAWLLMSVSSEHTARNFQAKIGANLEGIENMSPEEAGNALGEFLKGVQDATKEQ